MAIYDLGTASLAANGEVTGVGTTWKAPLTLIRVGATIVFKTEPVQIYTIAEIISDTQVNVYNPNSETVPAGTGYAILAHDGITVQGLAQDVAETLRYYQSRETEVSTAVDIFKDFDQDKFSNDVSQVNTQFGEIVTISAQVSADSAQVTADKNSAAASAISASNDKDSAAASAQEAADYAASLDTQNLLKKDLSLSDLTDKQLSRQNLDVYSKSEVDNNILVFRNELSKTGGSSLIGANGYSNLQDNLDALNLVPTNGAISISTAKSSQIKANSILLRFKYGTVNYRATGVNGVPGSGNAHTFYDASGKGFTISEPKRQKNTDGIVAFSEVWTALDLDPTLFEKASDLGVGTFMFYTWTAGVDTYRSFLDLARLYGFDVILQAVPNSTYSSNLDSDFAKLSPLFSHEAVVGLYLFDEPDLSTYPLTRQGKIIQKARSLSTLPLYSASNAEANYESVPLHMDIDYVFTSQYAHFIGPIGIRRYAATAWSSMEEEGVREGRIIPLLTAYWYENEAASLNKPQIRSVNNFICKNFSKIGMWAFYADKNGHFLESNQEIYDLVKDSLANRKSKIKSTRLIRTFFRKSNNLPDNSYKYQTKPVLAPDVFWLGGESISTWNADAGVLRLQAGQQFIVNFGQQVRLESLVSFFTDNNGGSNAATFALIFNPRVNNGRQYGTTVTTNGGGIVEWIFSDLVNPPHLVDSVAIKLLSSGGGDYLILERLGFVCN